MSKSSVGNTKRKQIMHLEEKTNETRIKHYLSLEWSLVYVEADGTLLLIFVKSEGKGKLELDKTFTSRKIRNVEYEDNDSPNIYINVESSSGTRRVLVEEEN